MPDVTHRGQRPHLLRAFSKRFFKVFFRFLFFFGAQFFTTSGTSHLHVFAAGQWREHIENSKHAPEVSITALALYTQPSTQNGVQTCRTFIPFILPLLTPLAPPPQASLSLFLPPPTASPNLAEVGLVVPFGCAFF